MGGATAAPRRAVDLRGLLARSQSRNLVIVWTTLALCIVVATFASDVFLSGRNIGNLGSQSVAILLVSLGQTLVLLTAGIDLSVGSVVSMVATLLPLVVTPTPGGILLGVVVALLAGGGVGLVNGLVITRLRLAPFMVTLATLSIVQGVALLLHRSPPAILPREFAAPFVGDLGPVPIPWIVVPVAVVLTAVVLRRTRFGRHVYAVGSNESATRLSGLRTDGIKVAVYALSGALAGLAGVFVAARARAGDPYIGETFAFDAITAVVLGGVSLFGGRGSVYGTVAAVFIVAILNNLLNLLGVESDLQFVLRGVLLIVAVAFYFKRKG